MKNIIILLLISSATYSQTLNVGIGATTNMHGNFNLGVDIDLFNAIRITPEFISMVPHQELSTYFGIRVGGIVGRTSAQLGYYYSHYSADKTEHTVGKNYGLLGGFISCDVYKYNDVGSISVQAGYLGEPQLLITAKINLSSR